MARALVVVCRYLGDTLLATPLGRALHKAGYATDWLVPPSSADVIRGQSFVKDVHVLQPNTESMLTLMRSLFRRYDVACVINGSDRPMAITLSAAKKTFALIPERPQDAWKRLLSTACIHNHPNMHVVSHAIELARLAGVTPCRDVGIEWDARDSKAALAAAGFNAGEYIVVHPFARWRYKQWSDAHWQHLIHRLNEAGHNIVITAAPDEREPAYRLAGDTKRVTVLAGLLDWKQLAALYHDAACYIGMDTANTHLAASTGTPAIALFGPTDPRRWGPWPNGFPGITPYRAFSMEGIQRIAHISLLQGKTACVPCHREGCEGRPDSESICLNQITVDLVLDEVRQRLEHRP